MAEKLFHLGIKALIVYKKKLLILYCENSARAYWDVPGGRVQAGEDILQTLQREVFEETGITELQGLQEIGMCRAPFRSTIQNGDEIGLIFAFFTAHVEHDTVVLSDEHQQYEWASKERALELVGNMGIKQFIEKMF